MHQTYIGPTPEIKAKTNFVACSAGCKAEVEDPEKVGWEFLPISRRWRCGDCGRELRLISGHMNGG